MSLLTILTKKPPEIGGITFDAVLEDELEFSTTIPTYPVESGAEISDHRIINPIKYRMVVAVSNTPLTQSFPDFATSIGGGLVSNLSGSGVVAGIAGLSAGFLASSNDTRSSAALEKLIELMEEKDPFDIDTGDKIIKNMVITKISRSKNPENENALIAVIDLQEFITLDRLNVNGQPSHTQLADGSKEQSACSSFVSKGVMTAKTASKKAIDYVKGVIG